jgi:hypothetical protein
MHTFFDKSWPQGRVQGEIQTSDLHIMRCGPQPIVLPLKLRGRTLNGSKKKIQNREILQCFLLSYPKVLKWELEPTAPNHHVL